jgi:hypothetical protein
LSRWDTGKPAKGNWRADEDGGDVGDTERDVVDCGLEESEDAFVSFDFEVVNAFPVSLIPRMPATSAACVKYDYEQRNQHSIAITITASP